MASHSVVFYNAVFYLNKEEEGGLLLLLPGDLHSETVFYRPHQNNFLLKNSQFQNPKSIWMLIFLELRLSLCPVRKVSLDSAKSK